MRNKYKSIAIVLLVLILLCACESRAYVDWHLTIPNDYYGFLVIQYKCPDGKPLAIQNGRIDLEFNDDGTACVSNEFLATSGKVFVKRKDGKPVQFAPREAQGYGLLWLQSIWGNQKGVDYGPFEVLWAGNTEDMAQHYSLEGLDEFLEEHFGVPQFNVVITPTPR